MPEKKQLGGVMRILFVDTACDGHHPVYAKELIQASLDAGNESVAILPETIDVPCSIVLFSRNLAEKKFKDYLYFLYWIVHTAREKKVDRIHILNGDYFYRFMGIGLGLLKKYRTIITFHSIRRGKLHDISLKRIFKKIDCGVVHTSKLEQDLLSMGIENVVHIEYPCFGMRQLRNPIECKRLVGADVHIPLLGAIGSTREDKGLDVLLEALEGVKSKVQLLVAGKEEYFNRSFIEEKVKGFSNKIILKLEFLTNDDLETCINACDIIVLPYKKIFDGASGPLVEGCYLRKKIVASSHGSLGVTVSENHLGITFESEDPDSLRCAIEEAVHNLDSGYDTVAESYRKSLDPRIFREAYLKLYQTTEANFGSGGR